MQLGFVGLGRMGGNMVHRILRDSEHEVVAWNAEPAPIEEAAAAPWPSASLTASAEKSNATTWWSESRWMRWTMFAPIFPSPTKPSCIRASP